MSHLAWTQEKCATVLINERPDQNKESVEYEFEKWVESQLKSKKTSTASGSGRSNDIIYTIPVVVHIVHNGEELGTGTNIPDEQIFSQIESLNEDFRRLNEDASNTPAEFLEVAADIEIEFALAVRDPEGLPTTGIERVRGSENSYDPEEFLLIAERSYWDASRYLNFWVADINGDFIGFAKFPLSNQEGLEDDQLNDADTDGAYIDYRYFGTGYNATDFSLGRTTTHEIGHWLGLRHIWGDNSICSINDYCEDTPPQRSSTSSSLSCSAAYNSFSCETTDMVQNYMDYSADECMNLFTLDQKNRMRIVIENSPRRKSLLSSDGLTEVEQFTNDLGIKEIISPKRGNCETEFIPEIIVRNYGTNFISNFSISMYVDGNLIETLSIDAEMESMSLDEVSFNSYEVSSETHLFEFIVETVNGSSDLNTINNTKELSAYFPETTTLPISENFSGSSISQPSSWFNEGSWSFAEVPNGEDNNIAAVLNYASGTSDNFGQQDFLVSPAISIIGISSLDLSFEYAYSSLPDFITDGLSVIVSTDCGATFSQINRKFMLWAPDLSTTFRSSDSFLPNGSGEWQTVEVNLSEFAGNDELIVAFIGHNGNGNNIYLDNISITSSSFTENDVSITSVENLPVVGCEDFMEVTIEVRNLGFNNLKSFQLTGTIEGQTQTNTVTNIDLSPGDYISTSMEFTGIEEGVHEITFEVSQPNQVMDQIPENNIWSGNFLIDQSTEEVPFKIDFLSSQLFSNWSYAGDSAIFFWELYVDDNNLAERSMRYEAFNNENVGYINQFVSPVLDLTGLNEASLRFDYSYAYSEGREDRLQVLISTDCGVNFDQVAFDKTGELLAVAQSGSEWFPESEQDWITEVIDLTDYLNHNDVRIAFSFTNQNGNHLYLDNIEFFDVAEPDSLELTDRIRIYPNPTQGDFNLKLNLTVRQDISIRLISMNGEIIMEEKVDNALNQNLYIDVSDRNIRTGLYILQVIGAEDASTQRIAISR